MASRTTAPTAAQLARAQKRLEHLEDPEQAEWHGAATAAIDAYNAELEEWEARTSRARNRAERRQAGRRPRLQLPPLPDFGKAATPAARATGPIFGRFVVVGASPDQPAGGTIHDVTAATEECRIGDTPRTFVHFRDEVAPAFPDAEPCPRCAAEPAGQA